jgi:AraC-like DNA-binding protein
MHQLNQILQIATATLVAFNSLLLIRSLKQGMHLWAGVGFSLSVLCYVIIEIPLAQQTFLRPIVLTGSACIPVFFWMLSRSIFDDHFKFTPSLVVWFVIQSAMHFPHYNIKGGLGLPRLVATSIDILEQIVSFGFVVAAIYEAVKTKQTDLIESRLRFRNTFITITALLIGITLIVEITPIAKESEDFLQVLQRSAILGLTGYFLISNFTFESGFFFREIQKPKSKTPTDPQLEEQLMTLLNEKKIYRNEGLTIRALADIMQVQEHRLRKLINSQLGFKNFNDFLNQYRVNEASEILSDATQNQKTILEIAYALGYQSIGPFNKAFKELKNTTPTAFRKAQRQ